jgi:hypothetical protein
VGRLEHKVAVLGDTFAIYKATVSNSGPLAQRLEEMRTDLSDHAHYIEKTFIETGPFADRIKRLETRIRRLIGEILRFSGASGASGTIQDTNVATIVQKRELKTIATQISEIDDHITDIHARNPAIDLVLPISILAEVLYLAIRKSGKRG